MKKITAILLAAVLAFSLLAGCQPVEDTTSSTSSSAESAAVSSTPAPVKEPVSLHFVAAGDNLIHSGIYKQAKVRAGGDGYDFNYAYEHVKPLINGDINILNQETLLASPTFEPSNYPRFSSPIEVGNMMIEMGFNVFTLANNHMLDKGTRGIDASLSYWDGKRADGILTAGSFRNQEELEEIRSITKKGVSVGFVSATEHTNGMSLPQNSVYRILYTADEETLERQIRATAEACDIVVVAVHWGVENSQIVSEQQTALAKKLVSWGADLIIGTHPHVLQKIEYLDKPDGEQAVVAYSLGNFISAMNRGPCMLGGVLDLTLTKHYDTGAVSVEDVTLIPIANHYESGYKNIRVYPLAEYTEALAKVHGVRKYTSGFDYAYLKNVLKKAISTEFLPDGIIE